ncbi:MAG: hypothetical protein H0U73_04270 [Tatlockia sp.]|nr:hypothetical protein [Tatlockia sp.]
MRQIAIIGLGYVGLGLALGLSEYNSVIGFDILKDRIKELKNNFDSELNQIKCNRRSQKN